MSDFSSFAKKAIRPMLIAAAVGTAPALFFSVLGIIASFLPRSDPEEFTPAFMVAFALFLVFFSAVATFSVAAIVAFVWYLLRQAWRKRELRLIAKRFGWTSQTK